MSQRGKLQPKERIGRYQIEHLAGRGGVGEVYRAQDLQTNQFVALKVLRDPEQGAEVLEREAWALRSLEHPNIVKLIELGDSHVGPFMAMEWLDGEQLSQRLSRGVLSFRELTDVASRVCDALSIAHRRGIVHQDIKPSNLFLVGNDFKKLKVLDFGLARAGKSLRSIMDKSSQEIVGTPSYMSPEQARAEDLAPSSDIFSLGCVLYQCLAGQPPFAAKHAMAVLAKIIFEEAQPLSSIRKEAPAALVALIHKMLHKSPGERPKDGDEMLSRLSLLGVSRSGPLPSLSRGEQKVLSVLAATRVQSEAADLSKSVRELVQRYQGRAEFLSDSSVVVVFASDLAAQDLAKQSASCALLLRELLPFSPMSLATGRGEAGPWPVGEVIDRAVQAVRGYKQQQNEILLDDTTASFLDERFVVKQNKLFGAREQWESVRTLLGKQTILVGREIEQETLVQIAAKRMWAQNRRSSAQGMLLFAPAGAGKSRLIQETLRQLKEEGAFSLWLLRADPTHTRAPLGMLSAMLRRVIGLSDGEPLRVQRAKLKAFFTRRGPSETPSEFLGELVGVPSEEESLQLRAARQDPRLMSDQMLRAWLSLLQMECRSTPLLLCAEDLQWADPSSLQWLDLALKELSDAPFFLLVAARPELREREPDLWAERFLDEIWLSPLSMIACRDLIRQALGEQTTEAIIEQLSHLSQGNAFYLEELIRSAASGKSTFPETILAMTQHRLLSLPEDARKLLRAASIFGYDFWYSSAKQLLADDSTIDDSLAYLLQEELLLEQPSSRFQGEREFCFTNALFYEAAYASLTEQDKALGHRLAAEWLEAHQEQDYSLLARHFELGGRQDKAIDFSCKAAQQAFSANDLGAALAFSEQGKRCGARGETLGQLCLLQAEVYNWQAAFAQSETFSLEAMSYFSPGSPLWYRAIAEGVLACGRLNHYEQLVSLSKSLLSQTWNLQNAAPLIAAARALPRLLHGGQEAVANDLSVCLREMLAAPTQDPLCTPWIEVALANQSIFRDAFDQARVHSEKAVEAFMLLGDLRNSCQQQMDAGFNALQAGFCAEAIEQLTASIAAAEELDIKRIPGAALRGLCFAYAFQGDLANGEACARRSIEALSLQGDKQQEANSRIRLSRVLLEEHRVEEAQEHLPIIYSLLPTNAPLHAYARGIAAKIKLINNENDEALLLATEAVRRFVKVSGVELGEFFIRKVYVDALLATNQHDAAVAAAQDALLHLEKRCESLTLPGAREAFSQLPDHARIFSLAAQLGVIFPSPG
jgi:serine/threonine protein kinase